MKRLSIVLFCALLAACASAPVPTPTDSLAGEVFYVQRIALPPSASLSVELQDVSRADAPAVALAYYKGPITGQVPIPFSLKYNRQQLAPGHRYAITARIEAEGHLLFVTTEHHGVQLDGQDAQPVRVRVHPAP